MIASILSSLMHINYMYILVRICMEGFIGNTQSNINTPEGIAQGINWILLSVFWKP